MKIRVIAVAAFHIYKYCMSTDKKIIISFKKTVTVVPADRRLQRQIQQTPTQAPVQTVNITWKNVKKTKIKI